MRNILLPILASLQLVHSSSITVDWSHQLLANTVAHIIDYVPPVGAPFAGSSLSGTTSNVEISGTIPAAEYTVYVSAVLADGTRHNVTQVHLSSSPDAPILDSIETTEHEATISFFPPQGQDITYSIEYYPDGQHEYANVVETKASLVRLRGLDSGTHFRLKIRSIYKNVPSPSAIETLFQTQGTPSEDYNSGSAESFTVRTLPPDLDLFTSTTEAYYEYSRETSNEEETTTMSQPSTTDYYTFATSQETYSMSTITVTSPPATVPITFAESAPPAIEVTVTQTAAPTTTTTRRPLKTTTSSISTTADYVDEESEEDPITTTAPLSKKPRPSAEEIDTGEYPAVGETKLQPLDEMRAQFGEPSEIEVSEENGKIRLDWTVSESQVCDAFFLNYTILTLSRPKSMSVATSEEFAVIKMFPEHTLDLRVFCMLAGSLSKTWWAHNIAVLAKPKPVDSLKVVSFVTDEFYVARIQVDCNWEYHDFDMYKIVITYNLDKGSPQTIEVTEKGPITIDKLTPAHKYIIAARNESLQLPLHSKDVQIEQMTPPLISSTLYPGQISSTAININFGDSDPEQGRFEHYVLTFSGNNKNITKKIEMHQERSLTFTKLIPGKTYHFELFTVYKGVRSRAVTEDVTTYPLKVNQLYPVVGKDYVVLYWDIENFADADCRFRLSYNADKLPTVSVELKGASRHRFTGLQADTYYTFTITVIMGNGKAAAESESEMVTVAIPKGRGSTVVKRKATRELEVTFENDHNLFSSLNGAVESVAIIVTDDVKQNDDKYELRSWFEVKDEETWGSYRASPSDYNPFNQLTRTSVFNIGTDDCIKRSLDEPFCNGILRANVDYMVKIRAYTDTKVAIETDWTAIEGAAGEDEEEDDKNERRLPCHMYLNGCPRKSSTTLSPSLSLITALLSLLLLTLF